MILLVFPELPQDNVSRIHSSYCKALLAQLLVHTKDPVVPFSLVLHVIDLGQERSLARPPVLEADATWMFPGSLEHVQHGHPGFPVDRCELFFHPVPVVDDKDDSLCCFRSLFDRFLQVHTERADQQTENQLRCEQVPDSLFTGNGGEMAEVVIES